MPDFLVENDKLRKAFLDSGLSASEVARRIGWYSSRPDASRVLRRLGVNPTKRGGQRATNSTHIQSDAAALITEALGLDPVDVGL